MTSWVVSDSGIFIRTVVEGPLSNEAEALIYHWGQENRLIAAPTLFQYEIVAVMRKSMFQKLLSEERAQQGRDLLLAKNIALFMDDDLLRRGYELARQFDRPTAYDSQYLAVAEHLGCEFWTIDEKLFNAVSQTLPWVKWVGNTTSEENMLMP